MRTGQRELPEMEEEVAFQDMKSCAQADAGVGPRLADTIHGHFPVGGHVEKLGVVTVTSRVSSVLSIGQCSGQMFLKLLSRVVSFRRPDPGQRRDRLLDPLGRDPAQTYAIVRAWLYL